jgi:hypothetical protein
MNFRNHRDERQPYMFEALSVEPCQRKEMSRWGGEREKTLAEFILHCIALQFQVPDLNRSGGEGTVTTEGGVRGKKGRKKLING